MIAHKIRTTVTRHKHLDSGEKRKHKNTYFHCGPAQ